MIQYDYEMAEFRLVVTNNDKQVVQVKQQADKIQTKRKLDYLKEQGLCAEPQEDESIDQGNVYLKSPNRAKSQLQMRAPSPQTIQDIKQYKEQYETEKEIKELNFKPDQLLQHKIQRGEYPHLQLYRLNLQKVFQDQILSANFQLRNIQQKQQAEKLVLKKNLSKLTNDNIELLLKNLNLKSKNTNVQQGSSLPQIKTLNIQSQKSESRTVSRLKIVSESKGKQDGKKIKQNYQSILKQPDQRGADIDLETPLLKQQSDELIHKKKETLKSRRKTVVISLTPKDNEKKDQSDQKVDLENTDDFQSFMATNMIIGVKKDLKEKFQHIYTKKFNKPSPQKKKEDVNKEIFDIEVDQQQFSNDNEPKVGITSFDDIDKIKEQVEHKIGTKFLREDQKDREKDLIISLENKIRETFKSKLFVKKKKEKGVKSLRNLDTLKKILSNRKIEEAQTKVLQIQREISNLNPAVPETKVAIETIKRTFYSKHVERLQRKFEINENFEKQPTNIDLQNQNQTVNPDQIKQYLAQKNLYEHKTRNYNPYQTVEPGISDAKRHFYLKQEAYLQQIFASDEEKSIYTKDKIYQNLFLDKKNVRSQSQIRPKDNYDPLLDKCGLLKKPKAKFINDNFFIDLQVGDIKTLDQIQEDLEYLLEQVKYNKYNLSKSWNTKQKRMNRAKNFENFILKYAKLIHSSGNSSNSSQQKYQKEGGESRTKTHTKKIIKRNKINFIRKYENDTSDKEIEQKQIVKVEHNKQKSEEYSNSKTNMYPSERSSLSELIDEELQVDLKSQNNPKIGSDDDIKKPKHLTTLSKSSDSDFQEKNYASQKMQSIQKYMNSQRIEKINDLKNTIVDDPQTQYFIETNNKHLYPKNMGFINKYLQNDSIYMNNNSLPDEFIMPFSNAIKVGKDIQNLYFKKTIMSSASATQIVQSMQAQNIKVLDFSENYSLNQIFYNSLSKRITESKQPLILEILDLSGNRMGDQNCEVLLNSLIFLNSLKILNLNKNQLTDKSVFFLCEVINVSSNLQALHLHYNRIKGKGATMLAHTLENNTTIKVLDLSFNSIFGSSFETKFQESKKNKNSKVVDQFKLAAQAWAQCLKINQDLIHLDISFNELRWEELEILGEGLASNNTLLGLHVQGNKGWVDSFGFLQPLEKEHAEFPLLNMDNNIAEENPEKRKSHKKIQKSLLNIDQNSSLSSASIDNLPIQPKRLQIYQNLGIKQISQELNAQNNCWICGQWTEIELNYYTGGENKIINIHIDSDFYQDDLMVMNNSPVAQNREQYMLNQLKQQPNLQKFTTIRRVPPGDRKYYFSIAGQQYFAKDQPLIEVSTKNYSKFETHDFNVSQFTDLPYVNIIQNIPRTQFNFTKEEIQSMKVFPRQIKTLDSQIFSKNKWNFETSVFRDFKIDDDKILAECFEFDWKKGQAKVDNILKDEEQRNQVKGMLKNVYKELRNAYKYLAGQDCQNNFMSIGRGTFNTFLSGCGDFIDQNINKQQVDILFASVINQNKKLLEQNKKQNIPQDRIIRYNFLVVFILLINNKFVQHGNTWFESISILKDKYLKPFFTQYDPDIWRQKVLWQEQNDLSLKRQYRILQKCFESQCTKKNSQKRFMLPSEFVEMLSLADIFNENFGRLDATIIWAQSMITHVDEINQDLHHQMQFPEFIEAMCRVADKIVIPNLRDEPNFQSIETFLQFADQNKIAQLKGRSLEQKIESFLLLMARNFLGNKFYIFQALPTLKQFIDNKQNANDILVSGSPWK